MRIVMLIETLGGGGAERVTVDLARLLAARGHDLTIAVPRMPPTWRSASEHATLREQVAELHRAGVRVLAWHRQSKYAPWEWRPLARLLIRHRPHVLHAHKLGGALWAVLLGRLCGVPVIVAHDHGASAWPEARRTFVYRHVVGPLADRVITVSRAHRDEMVERRGVPAHKVAIVINGTDGAGPSTDAPRERLGLPQDAPVVAAVAMLRPEKGLDILVRALALVRTAHPTVRAVVAGGGIVTHRDEPERLRTLTADLQLEDAVTFLGPRTDIANVLAAADVAVNSSHEEGTPIAVLEYMEAGLPIVATSVGGVPDMLRDGDEALLVPPGDPVALAGAVNRVLADAELARRLGSNGQRRRRSDFTLERTVEAVEALYRDALKAAGRHVDV